MSGNEFKKNDPEKAKQFFTDKMAFTTGPVELARAIKGRQNITIIDVREPEDYEAGHVPGARNLPRNRWEIAESLEKEKVNVIYCYSQVCHLAAAAAVQFATKGFSVIEMEGGFEGWKEHDLEIEKRSAERPRGRQPVLHT